MCRAILSSLPSPARQHVVGFPVVPDVYDAHLPQLAESAVILLESPIGAWLIDNPRIGPGEQPPDEHLVTAGHYEVDVESERLARHGSTPASRLGQPRGHESAWPWNTSPRDM